jgi:hypothetical protein
MEKQTKRWKKMKLGEKWALAEMTEELGWRNLFID